MSWYLFKIKEEIELQPLLQVPQFRAMASLHLPSEVPVWEYTSTSCPNFISGPPFNPDIPDTRRNGQVARLPTRLKLREASLAPFGPGNNWVSSTHREGTWIELLTFTCSPLFSQNMRQAVQPVRNIQ